MAMIEGIGDEVVQFVAVVLVIVVAALAWWSTNARPERYRTVLVVRSRTVHPVTVSIRNRPNLQELAAPTTTLIQGAASNTASAITAEAIEDVNERGIPLQEMDSIVDADMAMMDNDRLHFYRRVDTPTNTQTVSESPNDETEVHEEAEPASNAQIREMDSIVNAMEADVTAGCDFFTRANESNSSSNPTAPKKENNTDTSAPSTADVSKQPETVTTDNIQPTEGAGDATPNEQTEDNSRILIKLKYLNDTLKEVEGRLDELLKDFKWRHFSTELTAECRVRLIFNGHVLLDDSATLRACGLHDRAVVHCLVHPKRTVNQQRGIPEEGTVNVTHELITDQAPAERAWDLENILMTLVSVALTVVWFFRCEYSNLFTASASLALFGLTIFYSVAIFGLYLSDTFQFDRRPAQPVPDN